MAVRHSRAVQRLSSAPRQAESRPGRIGPISLDVKQMGERSARNPHAAFDVEGAGNVARSKPFDPNRRASPRPYLGARGGETPLRDSPSGHRHAGSAGRRGIHPADVQDRGGAGLVIGAIYDLFPWLRHLFADSAYTGRGLDHALAGFGHWTIEVVRRSAEVAGFAVLPRRWVVERTLAWLNRNRRLAKDFEASLASAKAWVYIASVQLLIRRLA